VQYNARTDNRDKNTKTVNFQYKSLDDTIYRTKHRMAIPLAAALHGIPAQKWMLRTGKFAKYFSENSWKPLDLPPTGTAIIAQGERCCP
jgi:hypothetical protein